MFKALILATALVATVSAAKAGTPSPATAFASAVAGDYAVTSSDTPQPGTRGPVIQL
ncbi:MAG TPA: hypothetical protein VHY76_11455 [Acetobacteraceae bacterium]|jgi:hypothetical protein|nr:hypothetical protein [Acetobacteraceae bacterium]